MSHLAQYMWQCGKTHWMSLTFICGKEPKQIEKWDFVYFDILCDSGTIYLLRIPLTLNLSRTVFPSGTFPCFPNATEFRHSSAVKNSSKRRWNKRRQSFFASAWIAARRVEDKKRPLSGYSSCFPDLFFGAQTPAWGWICSTLSRKVFNAARCSPPVTQKMYYLTGTQQS